MILDAHGLAQYVAGQLSAFTPDRRVHPRELIDGVRAAMARHTKCFEGVGIKGSSTTVDHLHTDQYAAFLCFLGRSLFSEGSAELAAKVYAVNKALHALDVFYEVEMPNIFAFQHPVGTVLGRGLFADYLFVYQRCSIGSNLAGKYPRLGEGVVMFGGSAIIGDCSVGPNTWLSVGATVMDESVPGNCIVFGCSPHLVVKPTKRDVRRDVFKVHA
jgi:serine O-acetyltransferase